MSIGKDWINPSQKSESGMAGNLQFFKTLLTRKITKLGLGTYYNKMCFLKLQFIGEDF